MKYIDDLNRLDDAFAQTPEGFHLRLEQQLHSLKQQARPLKRARLVPLIAALVLVLAATAFAASKLGVFYFLTERTTQPLSAQQINDNTLAPLNQQSEGGYVTAELTDGVLIGDTLSLCVRYTPKANDHALICEIEIGTDGEHSDWVWRDGKIYESLAQWVPKGKMPLVIQLPMLSIDGNALYGSTDWVSSNDGITFLVEVDVSDMPIIHEKSLAELSREKGTVDITVTAECLLNNEGEGVETLLAATIPVKKEE